MEALILIVAVLVERLRPDLAVRRAWARTGVQVPSVLGPVPTHVALAGLDLRRLLLRPATIAALYVLFRTLLSPPPSELFNGVNRLVGFQMALLGLAVVAISASTGGRDRRVEMIQAMPGGGRSRVSAWFLLLLGVASLEYVLLLVSRYSFSPPYVAQLPNPLELTQGPLLLLGGGMLGLLAARRLPPWVAAPVCVVACITWVVVLGDMVKNTAMLAPLVEWIQAREDSQIIFEPGSLAWHNAYLLGLCGLGLVAALLLEPGRRRALVVVGGLLTAFTVVAGVLAVP